MRLSACRPAIHGPRRALCAADVAVSFVMRREFLPGCHPRTQLTGASMEEVRYTQYLECSSCQHGPKTGGKPTGARNNVDKQAVAVTLNGRFNCAVV
jgi:hypothetical protein